MKFDARATTGTLQAELANLATQWERLKLSPRGVQGADLRRR